MTPKTKPFHKTGLILAGVLACFVVLELALRLGGFSYLYFQELRNSRRLQGREMVRILCLGESTTALGGESSFPSQLEGILNQNGRKFSVINKGIPATNTTRILYNLKRYLFQYQPDIVITMMGVNDAKDYITPVQDDEWTFLKDLRVYKLINYVRLHLLARFVEAGEADTGRSESEELEEYKTLLRENPTVNNLVKLGGLYRSEDDIEGALGAFERVLALDPDNCAALYFLGRYHKQLGDYSPSIDLFQKGLSLCEENTLDMEEHLVDSYRSLGEKDKAFQLLSRAIKRTPDHPYAFEVLAKMALDADDNIVAEKLLKKQLVVNPVSRNAYLDLFQVYKENNKLSAAERVLRRGIRALPKDKGLYLELGMWYFETGRYREAEEVLVRELKIGEDHVSGVLDDEIAYNYLLDCYAAQKKSAAAAELRAKKKDPSRKVKRVTYENYNEVAAFLEENNIVHIAVQYPARPVKGLKMTLRNHPRTVFVDNEKIFKTKIKRKGRDFCFLDRFAGDLGHCTPEGNKLLAENIAKTIREVVEWRIRGDK